MMRATRLGMGLMSLILLVGCRQGATLISAPQTVEELISRVDGGAELICNLDLSTFSVDVDAPEPPWDEILDYGAFVENGAGDSLAKVYRRAALRRKLMAGDAVAPYAEFNEPPLTPDSLESHLDRVDYWSKQREDLWAQRAALETPDADPIYNARSCVINEQGGAAQAAARQAALDMWENGDEAERPAALDAAYTLIMDRGPDEEAYEKTWLAFLANLEPLSDAEIGRLGLMRDGQTAIVSTDPTDFVTYQEQRRKEAPAVRAYIEDRDWETIGEELAARVRLDQSLRAVHSNQNHFENYDRQKMSALVTATINTDEANTAWLKDMMDGRDWFRDDQDGERAAQNAWLLVQHADRDPDFQRAMLPKIEAAIGNPGVSAQNYAYLYDRVAGKDERPQRYGTQGRCQPEGGWAPNAVEDPDNLDARRADVGLGPIADYIKRFEGRCLPE